jgi:hypothetical protein
MKTRIYLVTDTETKGARLVRAVSQASAIRHCCEARFLASIASQDELVSLISEGFEVESPLMNGDSDSEQSTGDH